MFNVFLGVKTMFGIRCFTLPTIVLPYDIDYFLKRGKINRLLLSYFFNEMQIVAIDEMNNSNYPSCGNSSISGTVSPSCPDGTVCSLWQKSLDGFARSKRLIRHPRFLNQSY